MGWKAGSKILQSDLLVGLRHWYSSIANRDTDITVPVAGTKAVIGSRTASTDTLWEYLYDGYQWVVVTAPWTALVITTGFSGFNNPAVRVDGGLVNFRGSIQGPMPNYTSTTLATVPVGFRPPSNDGRSMKTCTSTAGAVFPYAATWASGELVANPGGGGGTLQILLGGLSGYSLI